MISIRLAALSPACSLRVLGCCAGALLVIWCALAFLAFPETPPLNVRFIRGLSILFILAFALLEYLKRWTGVGLFLLIWPHMLVLRELGVVWMRGWINEFPVCWHGPVAAAIGVGIWLHHERARRHQRHETLANTPSKHPAPSFSGHQAEQNPCPGLSLCLWTLIIIWLLAAALGFWRSSVHADGWVVDGSSWGRFFKLDPFAAYRPLSELLAQLPVFVLGLILLNSFPGPFRMGDRSPSGHTDYPNVPAVMEQPAPAPVPVRGMLWCACIGGLLAVLQVLWQVGMASRGSFALLQNEYGLRLWEHYRWSFDLGPPSGPFAHRNTVAPFMFVVAVLFWALAAEIRGAGPRSRLRAWLLLLPGLLCLWAVGLTQSRNGLLLVLALPSLALLVKATRQRLMAALGLPLLLIGIVAFAPLPRSADTSSALLGRVFATLELLKDRDWHEGLSGRPRLFGTAWKIFKHYPLSGSGLGTFPMLSSPCSLFGEGLDTNLITAQNWPGDTRPPESGHLPKLQPEKKAVEGGQVASIEGEGREPDREVRNAGTQEPALLEDAHSRGVAHVLTPQVFPAGFRPAGTFYSAHSTPMHLLAETGIFGCLGWVFLFVVWPLWAVFRLRRGNVLALAVLGFGLSNLLDTPWMVPGMATMAMLVMVLACCRHATAAAELHGGE